MAPGIEAQRNLGRILSELQRNIGQLNDKQAQDAQLELVLKRLKIPGKTNDWRNKLGKAARGHGGTSIEDIFTKKAVDFLSPAYLEQLEFEVPDTEEEEDSEFEEPATAEEFGRSKAAQKEAPRAANSGLRSWMRNGQSKKRGLESPEDEPPAKRVKSTNAASPDAEQNQQGESANGLAPPKAAPALFQDASSKLNTKNTTINDVSMSDSSDEDSDEEPISRKRKRPVSHSEVPNGKRVKKTQQEPMSMSNPKPSFPAQSDVSVGASTNAAPSNQRSKTLVASEGQRLSNSASSKIREVANQAPIPERDLEAELKQALAANRELTKQLKEAKEEIDAAKARQPDAQMPSASSDANAEGSAEVQSLKDENKMLQGLVKQLKLNLRAQMHENEKQISISRLRKGLFANNVVAGMSLARLGTERAMVLSDVTDLMNSASKKAIGMIDCYISDRKMLDNELDAELVIDSPLNGEPQHSKLHALYAQVFGTKDWQRYWLNQQLLPDAKVPWFRSFMIALIGAGVYQTVFSRSSSWSFQACMKKALGEKYAYIERVGDAVQVEESLRLAQYGMYMEGGFKEEIDAHAKRLAEDLADTLMPQIKLWNAAQIRAKVEVRAANRPTKWIDQLVIVFQEALKLRVLMETYEDGKYATSDLECVWPNPGDEVAPERVMPDYEIAPKHKQRIRYTMWAGLDLVLKNPLVADLHEDITEAMTRAWVVSDHIKDDAADGVSDDQPQHEH